MKKMLVYKPDPETVYTVTVRKKKTEFRTYEEAKAYAREHFGAVLSYKWDGNPPTYED